MKQGGMKLLSDSWFSLHDYMDALTKERFDAFERPRPSQSGSSIDRNLMKNRACF